MPDRASAVLLLGIVLGAGAVPAFSAADGERGCREARPSASAPCGERHRHRYRHGERERVRELREAGAILPLETILERARAHRTGRILEAELERHRQGYVYEIEMLDAQGRVWELTLDAGSGVLLEDHRED